MSCSNCIQAGNIVSCTTQLTIGTIADLNTAVTVIIENLTTERIVEIAAISDNTGLVVIDTTGITFNPNHTYMVTVASQVPDDLQGSIDVTLGTNTAGCIEFGIRDAFDDSGNAITEYHSVLVAKPNQSFNPGSDSGDGSCECTIAVGTVTTLPFTEPATVSNVGTGPNAIFNFGIPMGYRGATGPIGHTGSAGATGPTGAQGPAGNDGVDGDKWSTTSVTSNTIGTGSKSFTVQTNLAYVPTQPVTVANDASNYMTGTVTSYNSGTGALVVNVTATNGSGTFASWSISLTGIQGPPGPTGATGATGATGPTGPQGPAGNGSSLADMVFTGPDYFMASHSTDTFADQSLDQTYIDANYPGIGATTTDMIDWAAWQMAVNTATQYSQPIIAYGHYYVDREITIEKYFENLTIDGGGCYVHATAAMDAIFKRIEPTDNSDANVMINAYITMRNIRMGSTGGYIQTTGIKPGPTYGTEIHNCKFYSIDWPVYLQFCLNASVFNCEAVNCEEPFYAGIGDWTGADNANSQSNHTQFVKCRYYATDTSDSAFEIDNCSGCVVENSIIEGLRVDKGINIHSTSTVVKDMTVRNVHFECLNGATTAFVYCRLLGGIVTVDKVFGQYASILCDAGATVGYLDVKISNVPYWVPAPGNFYFSNAGATSWCIDWCDNMFSDVPTIPDRWTGTAVSLATAGTMGNGNNRVIIPQIVPR